MCIRDSLRHNPNNPAWADRDRFVLSNGHGSMLIYSLLHLTGYDPVSYTHLDVYKRQDLCWSPRTLITCTNARETAG